MPSRYVHGYADAENLRLHDQAATLEGLLHGDTAFPAGSAVLEAGCGVGAQTEPLVRNSPGAAFTCVDISAGSLEAARARVAAAGLPQPVFGQADLHALPFPDNLFDHAFVCFVLEHLPHPEQALREIRRVVRPGGSVTVIEGDHGSALFHPENAAARAAIACQVALQGAAGGDAAVGRRLRPMLAGAGLDAVRVSPRPVYADGSRPALQDAFTRRTFTAMVAGVRTEAIRAGLVDADAFDAGIAGLLRTAEPDGVFCYTFFKAVGLVPRADGGVGVDYLVRSAARDDAEGISRVILAALRHSNAKDYPPAVIARVEESFTPAAVSELLQRRVVFVAVGEGSVVGTASLDGRVVRTVFIDPAWQKQGIGRALMAEVERAAVETGVGTLAVPSTITAEAFYARLGFRPVRDSFHGEERTIVMERELPDGVRRGPSATPPPPSR